MKKNKRILFAVTTAVLAFLFYLMNYYTVDCKMKLDT